MKYTLPRVKTLPNNRAEPISEQSTSTAAGAKLPSRATANRGSDSKMSAFSLGGGSLTVRSRVVKGRSGIPLTAELALDRLKRQNTAGNKGWSRRSRIKPTYARTLTCAHMRAHLQDFQSSLTALTGQGYPADLPVSRGER